MAVDTREKRFGMMAFGDGAILHALPEADAGGVEADDRAHLLGLYGGIAFGGGGVGAEDMIPPWKKHWRIATKHI